ncbi:MAG: hypothetical protein CVU46_09545 [Chloroflexi bacterium HGW-Chloroflexi-8]|nr:MAG: hypothetical protein CVU46_09545 [Chloroflexi bacterium HGW-Chloroflexi-8]
MNEIENHITRFRELTRDPSISQFDYCPHCQSNQVYVADRCNYVICRICKMAGPNGKSEEEAIEHWNNLPRRKSNDEEKMAEYEREMQVDCDNCGGSGILAEHHRLCSGDGEDCQVFNCPIEVQCGKCHATGKINRDKIGATWPPIDNELPF